MKNFFIITLAVLSVISLGLTGCSWDSEVVTGKGTLRITNQSTDLLSDTIDRISIRIESSTGELIHHYTGLNFGVGQNRTYSLDSGKYHVSITDNVNFVLYETVTIHTGRTTTIIWTGDNTTVQN